MAQIWEYIKIALMNIKSNKGRSILTMLGIIIGIASVIMIISIGNGVRSSVNEELENMGGGLIAIYTNDNEEGNDVKFTEEDFALIKEKVQHVKGATAQYGYYGATARGRKDQTLWRFLTAEIRRCSMQSAASRLSGADIFPE